MTEPRLIEISPVTRVEGHGKVTIHLNRDNEVDEARLHVVEFRGFERFIRGRFYWEVPVIVQRLCGICPVSHHLAGAKAMDQIVGVDVLPPTAEKMRRLMHYGQVMQSHVLHFFHLAAPDLLFGFEAPAARRNIFEILREKPELGRRAILMRQFGQEIIEATAGKKIHGTGAIPGGINHNLPTAVRDRFLARVDEMELWALEALAIARGYTLENAALVAGFGSFPSNHMSLVRDGDGALDLYHGSLRCIDAAGATLFDGVDYRDYHKLLVEDVRSWSYMKFPFIRALDQESELDFDLALQDTTDFDQLGVDDTLELPGSSGAVTGGAPMSESLEDLTRSMDASLAGLDLDEEPVDDSLLDLDLGSLGTDAIDLDFSVGDIGQEPADAPSLALEDDEFALERTGLRLDQSSAAAPEGESRFPHEGDEADTKLNLAKAYIELGDSEGARTILDEVTREGSAAQQQEARQLLSQLA